MSDDPRDIDPRDIEIAQLREALSVALETPVFSDECSDLEYELRGPEALIVFADSGEIPAGMASHIRMSAARWSIAIKDRARLQKNMEAEENAARANGIREGLTQALALADAAITRNAGYRLMADETARYVADAIRAAIVEAGK